MELPKHSNHRNLKYLSWLRKQNCVVSGDKAQCAHHIRLGTNGGSSLKPSDYFCIPLLNEYHTTGSRALHIIGEDTFLKEFNLDKVHLFNSFLKQYLIEEFDTYLQLDDQNPEALLAYMINIIEEKGPKIDKPKKLKKKIKPEETQFQKEAKVLKKAQDKELRAKLKDQKPKVNSAPLKGNEFYEKAKAAKRAHDKELREKLKKTTKSPKSAKKSSQESEFKLKQKELMAKYRKEQYQKSKELKAKRAQS